jgi:hypothetical protein
MVDRKWAQDPRVIDRYGRALAEGDGAAAQDLVEGAPHVWSDAYIESLIRMVELGKGDTDAAMTLLDRHCGAWAKDKTIGSRLRQALLSRNPNWKILLARATGVYRASLALADTPLRKDVNGGTILSNPVYSDAVRDGLNTWRLQVRWLAFTHDPMVVSDLRPYLQETTPVLGMLGGGAYSMGEISIRASEFAHDAILHVRSEPGEFGTLKNSNGLIVPKDIWMWHGDPAEFWPLWDADNASLIRRLDSPSDMVPSPLSPEKLLSSPLATPDVVIPSTRHAN